MLVEMMGILLFDGWEYWSVEKRVNDVVGKKVVGWEV